MKKKAKEVENKDKYDEDKIDEEPLFITQLLEWWSTKKACVVQGDSTQDQRFALEGSETQNCLLSGKLKTARGFGISGKSRPWLCSRFSSEGHNGCWRCRHAENGQENFVKYFEERKREARGQHAASTGELESIENTREMIYRENNISWREQVGHNNVAELKKVVAKEEGPLSAPQPKVTNTAITEHIEKSDQNKCYKKKKSDLFRQLKHWRPSLPVVIENGTEAEDLQSKEDDLSNCVLLEEKVVMLKKEILNARAEHLSLKILNLIIDGLSKSTEKSSTSSRLNPNAEAWKPSHPVGLKEAEKCLPSFPFRGSDASQAGSNDEKRSAIDIPGFKTETSKRGIVQKNINDQPSLRPCDPVFSWMMGCRLDVGVQPTKLRPSLVGQ